MSRLLILLMFLLLAGCGNGKCLNPGEGVSESSIEIKVPVKPLGANRGNPASYWINSGQSITSSQSVKLTVEGTINFCPKDTKAPVVIKMFNDDAFNRGEFYEAHLKVVKGDILVFGALQPTLEGLDCSAGLSEKGIIFYKDDEIFSDNNCSAGISARDLCSSGKTGFYMQTQDKQCVKFDGVSIPRIGGKSIKVDRGILGPNYLFEYLRAERNGQAFLQTPPDWIMGKYAHDERTVKFTQSPKLDKSACDVLKEYSKSARESVLRNRMLVKLDGAAGGREYRKEVSKAIDAEETRRQQNAKGQRDNVDLRKILEEYTEYDLNCRCGNICRPSDPVSKNCVRSIVKVYNGNVLCNTFPESDTKASSQLTGSASIESLLGSGGSSNTALQEMAQGVVAEVCSGSGCIPVFDSPSDSISDNSLLLGKQYEMTRSGDLSLIYELRRGRTATNRDNARTPWIPWVGLYTLTAHRTCYTTGGKKLYMYIGNSAPTFFPGASGANSSVIELDMDKIASGSGWVYEINAKGSSALQSGGIYFGIETDPLYDDQLEYDDKNHYSVRIFTTRWTPTFSSFFKEVKGVILKVLYGVDGGADKDLATLVYKSLEASGSKGAIQQIYDNQTTSKPFWKAVQALLTLYLVFSVLGYIIGVIQVTKYDLAVRVAKMSLIICLFSPDSWRFFNEHFFAIFIVGVADIISAFSGHLDGDTSFAFLDSTMGVLFTSEVWIRFLALFAAGPAGWVIFVAIVWACIRFFIAMIKALIAYLFCIIAVAFLITLSPLFFTFILFQFTKSLFDAWLKMLLNFSLQPIIMFSALALLNQIIMSALYGVTGFTACERCAIGITLPIDDEKTGGSGQERKDLCLLYLMLPIGFPDEISIDERIREEKARDDVGFMGLPFAITVVLVLVVACNAIKDFIRLSEVMANSISGSVAGVTGSVIGATQAMLSPVGLDDRTQQLIKMARGMDTPSTEKLAIEGTSDGKTAHRGSGVSETKGESPDADSVSGSGTSGNADSVSGSGASGNADSVSGSGPAGESMVPGSRSGVGEEINSAQGSHSDVVRGSSGVSGLPAGAADDAPVDDGRRTREDGISTSVAGIDNLLDDGMFGGGSSTGAPVDTGGAVRECDQGATTSLDDGMFGGGSSTGAPVDVADAVQEPGQGANTSLDDGMFGGGSSTGAPVDVADAVRERDQGATTSLDDGMFGGGSSTGAPVDVADAVQEPGQGANTSLDDGMIGGGSSTGAPVDVADAVREPGQGANTSLDDGMIGGGSSTGAPVDVADAVRERDQGANTSLDDGMIGGGSSTGAPVDVADGLKDLGLGSSQGIDEGLKGSSEGSVSDTSANPVQLSEDLLQDFKSNPVEEVREGDNSTERGIDGLRERFDKKLSNRQHDSDVDSTQRGTEEE